MNTQKLAAWIRPSLAGSLVLLLLQACAVSHGPLPATGVPSLAIVQHGCGALLRDDFDRDHWNPNFWVWVQDQALRVYLTNGQLRITGVTGQPIPVCRDHHEFRFTGLVSSNFVQRDVVLACQMQALAPLPRGDTRVRYVVHLCGAQPDYFVDAALCHEPDGRDGWFFNPIGAEHPVSHDFTEPFVPLARAAPDQPHTVAIDYDPRSGLCRGFLVDGDAWIPIGKHRLYLSTVQAEIKVDVPYDGVTVDVAFDNVRLYPRPATNPVRIVVVKPPFPGFPFRGVRVALEDERGGPLGTTALTDANGEASIRLPADRLYPAGGAVRLTYRGRPIGTATIKAAGVRGLYPGDVWVITAPEEYHYQGRTYPLGY